MMEEIVPKDSEQNSALAKVINNLIDKIANAIGWVFTHDTPERIATKTYIEDIKKVIYHHCPRLHLLVEQKKI